MDPRVTLRHFGPPWGAHFGFASRREVPGVWGGILGCALALACVPRAQVRQLEDAMRRNEQGCQEQARDFRSRLAAAQQEKEGQREQLQLCEQQAVQRQQEFEVLQSQHQELKKERDDLSQRLAAVVHDRVALESTMAELRGALQRARDRRREESLFEAQEDAWMRHFGPELRESGAEVAMRDEGIMVVIPSDPLFQLNSAALSTRGQDLLKKISQQLRSPEFSRYRLQIRGHTDNVPTRTATLLDNWDVSTARALAVLQALVRDGLDPARLSAAGFGEYLPRTENLTRSGRQQNRRIEILLQRRP